MIGYKKGALLLMLCFVGGIFAKKKCCYKLIPGPQGATGPQGLQGRRGAQGPAGPAGLGGNFIAVYANQEQQSGIRNDDNLINTVDSVVWNPGVEEANGWSLCADCNSLDIALASQAIFAITYTVNAQSNYPFVSFLALDGENPIPGSELSVPATQSPAPATVTCFVSLSEGEHTIQLLFNGAITPQNSTSAYANNQTKDIKCISAALSIIQIGTSST
jgi:hypothetical protein